VCYRVYGWLHLVKATDVTARLAESNGSRPPGGWLKVTCGLTACTLGPAPGPTLGKVGIPRRRHGHRKTATPTSSPTSSRGSSRECRLVVQLAIGRTSGNRARVGRVGEDPREDVRVGVSVGVVEFQLNEFRKT